MLNRLALDPLIEEEARRSGCAIALSGGSDSTALMLLLQEAKLPLRALIIDHGLRAGSDEEAAQALAICKQAGIKAEIIRVDARGEGNLQARARVARYKALKSRCREAGIGLLALGHNADDQRETLILNALRGSGVDGLAAMPPVRGNNPKIIRPLLHIEREELRDYLRKRGIKWIDDPSNESMDFERVKIRKWFEAGRRLGLDFGKLARTQSNMANARRFLEGYSEHWMREHILLAPLNIEAEIDREKFAGLSDEIALRVLAHCCRYFGQARYRPRRDPLCELNDKIRGPNPQSGGMTLGGAEFHWSGKRLRICAEFTALPTMSEAKKWHRFQYVGELQEGETIGALGESTLRLDFWRGWGISARAAKTLPAIYRDGALMQQGVDEAPKRFAFSPLTPGKEKHERSE